MQELTRSGDYSYILSVQVALDAEGIAYRTDSGGSAYAFGLPHRVFVAAGDYERAREALATLSHTPGPTRPRNPLLFRVLGGLLAVTLVAAAIATCFLQ